MAILTPRTFILAALAALPTLAACTGTTVNSAEVYKPVTGVIQMDITVPATETTIQSVRFLVDDKLVQEDEDGSDGYSAELDTSEYTAESLVKISAVGVRANKTTVTLRENYIMIGKPADDADTEATTDSTTSPEPSPSPSDQ